MKHITILLLILTLGSCGMGRHVPHHGALNRTGFRAQKDLQDRLSGQYDGPSNLKRPNKFKRRHFPKRLTGDLLYLECPEWSPTACGDSLPICVVSVVPVPHYIRN